MRRPDRGEDAKNLSLISVSGVIALIVTAALAYAHSNRDKSPIQFPIPATPPTVVVPLLEIGPVSVEPRLYGTVATRHGDTYSGFIRWDRNEGSWADVLDANKVRDRGSVTQAGIRFGHIRRIEPQGRDGALLTLKSGEQVRMEARATDLGDGLRALVVETPGSGDRKLQWRDLESVEFGPAPEGVSPREARNFGTLTTRNGLEFTGYIAWDVDEIYTTDVLDGDADGARREIPFGSIASIERAGSRAARVTLKDGTTLVLRGTNDVNSSIGGISVSDFTLGEVKMDWREFESVRFHPAEVQHGWGSFGGGRAVTGTVLTEDGHEFKGEIAWDHDETRSWEMLNGEMDGIEFQIELGNVARIRKTGRGALVELRDGRTFELDGSNDVDDGNRGIGIWNGTLPQDVGWDEFAEVRFDNR
jgi:hypothetical protein